MGNKESSEKNETFANRNSIRFVAEAPSERRQGPNDEQDLFWRGRNPISPKPVVPVHRRGGSGSVKQVCIGYCVILLSLIILALLATVV